MKITDYADEIKYTYIHKTTGDMRNWPVPDDLENWYKAPFTDETKSDQIWDDTLQQWVVCGEKHNVAIRNKRSIAYQRRADFLFMEWQYDEAIGAPSADEAKQKWINAVGAIKAAHPINDV